MPDRALVLGGRMELRLQLLPLTGEGVVLPGEGGMASGASSWASRMFDTARDAAGDVVTELSSFTKFQGRVDELIRDLKGSEAGPRKVGQEQLVRHQFGGGDGAWAEAAGLFDAYRTVITELENLSTLLSDSMECMGIAVLASHKGYENIDLGIRDRMAAISTETTEQYGGSFDPGLPQKSHGNGSGTAPEQAAPSSDSGGTI